MNTPNNQNQTETRGIMKWVPLFIMSLALAIIILDTTILNVTLRTIIGDLNTTLQKIQWVITAYALMLAAFTITGGRLGDLFGRKRMFVTGAIIFAVGSFMTSIAHSVWFMIVGEAIIEGIGACLMLPATLSLLRSAYKGRDLQVAFGIWGGLAAGAAALGPVIGGWFTTHYSWRWAFRINVFVVLLLVLGSIFIKEYRDTEEKQTIDIGGIILSALGMLSIVFGFTQASIYGWWQEKASLSLFGHTISFWGISATPYFVILGIVLLALFLLWERHVERSDRTPLVSPDIFKNKAFLAGSLVTALLTLGQAGLSFSIPVYFQAVLGLDPVHTGIAMIPMTAMILFAAPFSSWLVKYVSSKHIIQIGIISDAIGLLILRNSLHTGVSQWALAPGFILFGLGMGFMFAQSSHITLSSISVEQSGEASGVMNTFRSLGQTLGSAVLGAVLLTTLATQLSTGIQQSVAIPQQVKPVIMQSLSSQSSNLELGEPTTYNGQIPQPVIGEITSLSHTATVEGNRTSLIYGILFVFVALIASMWLPSESDMRSQSLAHHVAH